MLWSILASLVFLREVFGLNTIPQCSPTPAVANETMSGFLSSFCGEAKKRLIVPPIALATENSLNKTVGAYGKFTIHPQEQTIWITATISTDCIGSFVFPSGPTHKSQYENCIDKFDPILNACQSRDGDQLGYTGGTWTDVCAVYQISMGDMNPLHEAWAGDWVGAQCEEVTNTTCRCHYNKYPNIYNTFNISDHGCHPRANLTLDADLHGFRHVKETYLFDVVVQNAEFEELPVSNPVGSSPRTRKCTDACVQMLEYCIRKNTQRAKCDIAMTYCNQNCEERSIPMWKSDRTLWIDT